MSRPIKILRFKKHKEAVALGWRVQLHAPPILQ